MLHDTQTVKATRYGSRGDEQWRTGGAQTAGTCPYGRRIGEGREVRKRE